MRFLTLIGIALVLCTGCHTANRGGPMGFGLLGSNPGNGVATAPPVYATPPQYVQMQQPTPVVAAPQQVVTAPQPIIMQQAPVAAQPQVVMQQQPQQVVPTSYYQQSNACQPCQPVCQPSCCQ
jgi:hypothetical protein